MKIVTAVFDYPGENEYTRCLSALRNSIQKTNPSAKFECMRLEPPKECYSWNKPGWHNNHIKLEAYSKVKITEPTFFVDADTIFIKDIRPLARDYFDIAIGQRPAGAKAPFNCGVMLFNPTDKAREFLRLWYLTDVEMLDQIDFHLKYRKKYSGQNQSSFGYLYETLDINIKKYPTVSFNACEQDWHSYAISYIVHVKTRLRDAALSGKPLKSIKPRLRGAASLWRYYEKLDIKL